MVLRCMIIGMLLGAVTEAIARTLGLWVYRRPQTPIINVVVMFGLIMGGIASLVGPLGIVGTFVLAFAIGLAYEIANLRLLDWWYFPGDRMAFVRGHAAIALVLAVLWGSVPLLTAACHGVLFR